MLTRRRALAILGAAGIGTGVFQRALAVKATEGPVTPQMIADAEWVAGIRLTAAQREAAVKRLNQYRESTKRIRAIDLDNAQRPGLVFAPLTGPASRPDPRGYQAVAAPTPVSPHSPHPLPRGRGRGWGEGAPARPRSDDDLAFASIRQLGSLLRSRKISSVELTKLYLARLRRYDPLLKCVVTFMDEVALRQAKRADRELAQGKDRGPLHGIPWGLKDIIAYPGYPTTWCAPQYRHRIINVKAAVAERLENAGAVLIAKLASNPFAGGGVEWYRGLTRNPWNPHQDAAGSSSGSGSAIAAGLVGFSIATDTGGSIIHPSIRCGTVGLRPTYGRVSRRRGEPKGVHGWPRVWAYGHLLSAVDYLKFSRLRAILMERFEKLMRTIDICLGNELTLHINLAGYPEIAFPRKFDKEHGFLVPRPQLMAGRAYDESTLLALADAYQRAIGLNERPPLEKFLAEKDQFLKDEKVPDEKKLYTD
jgi:hypothetical protein